MTNVESSANNQEKIKPKRRKKKKQTPKEAQAVVQEVVAVVPEALPSEQPLTNEITEGPLTKEEAFWKEFPLEDWPIIHIPVGTADDRRDNARQFHRGDTQEVPITSAEAIFTDPLNDGDLSISEAEKKQANVQASERDTHADLVEQGLIDGDVHTPDLEELQPDNRLPQDIIDAAKAHEERAREALARTTLEVPIHSFVEPKFNDENWIAGLPRLTPEQIAKLPHDTQSGMPSETTVAARAEGQQPQEESLDDILKYKFKAFLVRVGEELGEWAVETWVFKQLMKYRWFKEWVDYVPKPLNPEYVETQPEDMPRVKINMKEVLAGRAIQPDDTPIS